MWSGRAEKGQGPDWRANSNYERTRTLWPLPLLRMPPNHNQRQYGYLETIDRNVFSALSLLVRGRNRQSRIFEGDTHVGSAELSSRTHAYLHCPYPISSALEVSIEACESRTRYMQEAPRRILRSLGSLDRGRRARGRGQNVGLAQPF